MYVAPNDRLARQAREKRAALHAAAEAARKAANLAAMAKVAGK